MSNSPSENDSRVASSARNSRFGRERLLPLGTQLGVVEVDAYHAAGAKPLRPLGGEPPSPQPTSSTDAGAARSQNSSSDE